MKKIIFVINNFETGGVQKSLSNLINEIHDKYDITVLTFFGNEEFEKLLPQSVKVIETKNAFRQLGLSSKDISGKPFLYLERVFLVALTRIFSRSFVMKLLFMGKRKYKGYDVAISYIHEAPQKNLYGGCNEFVLKMVSAEKKIGWIHCDYGKCGADIQKSRGIYERFDYIVACSEGCRAAFLDCFPHFEDKTLSIRNCNPYDNIKILAGDGIEYDKDFFNIVTVARLSEEKGIERALEAVHSCILKGYKVRYHIVGSGGIELFLKNKCSELNLGDSVVFYGNQSNPYPYVKNADLFLLPSYHEAAPVVFDEAACLGVPVLATKTTSTYEMVEKNKAGLVCENSEEGIRESLLALISDREFIAGVKEDLAGRHFTNQKIVDAIENLF